MTSESQLITVVAVDFSRDLLVSFRPRGGAKASKYESYVVVVTWLAHSVTAKRSCETVDPDETDLPFERKKYGGTDTQRPSGGGGTVKIGRVGRWRATVRGRKLNAK